MNIYMSIYLYIYIYMYIYICIYIYIWQNGLLELVQKGEATGLTVGGGGGEKKGQTPSGAK